MDFSFFGFLLFTKALVILELEAGSCSCHSCDSLWVLPATCQKAKFAILSLANERTSEGMFGLWASDIPEEKSVYFGADGVKLEFVKLWEILVLKIN